MSVRKRARHAPRMPANPVDVLLDRETRPGADAGTVSSPAVAGGAAVPHSPAAAARFDATLLVAWLALLAVGVVMVASAAAGRPGGADSYLVKHLVFVAASIAIFLVLAATPLRLWRLLHRPCLLVAIGLCALVLVPVFSVEVNGARRWIDFGVARLQPAESAKLLVAIYLAGYVARVGDHFAADWSTWLAPLAWVGVVLVLVLCQPDFGSVVVLATLAGGLLFLAGARLRSFGLLTLLGGLALAAVAVLQPYRVERLVTFLDPWATQFDGGYQLTQALIAFGRGGYLGLGLGEGVQKLFYLPEAHNDFIYAVIAEEFGLAGAVGVLALFAVVTVRMLRIARAAVLARQPFAGLLAYGAALLIGGQALINAGVNTGVLPTKGMTLPFVSFGGNSILVCSALVALAFRAHWESAQTGAGGGDAER